MSRVRFDTSVVAGGESSSSDPGVAPPYNQSTAMQSASSSALQAGESTGSNGMNLVGQDEESAYRRDEGVLLNLDEVEMGRGNANKAGRGKAE